MEQLEERIDAIADVLQAGGTADDRAVWQEVRSLLVADRGELPGGRHEGMTKRVFDHFDGLADPMLGHWSDVDHDRVGLFTASVLLACLHQTKLGKFRDPQPPEELAERWQEARAAAAGELLDVLDGEREDLSGPSLGTTVVVVAWSVPDAARTLLSEGSSGGEQGARVLPVELDPWLWAARSLSDQQEAWLHYAELVARIEGEERTADFARSLLQLAGADPVAARRMRRALESLSVGDGLPERGVAVGLGRSLGPVSSDGDLVRVALETPGLGPCAREDCTEDGHHLHVHSHGTQLEVERRGMVDLPSDVEVNRLLTGRTSWTVDSAGAGVLRLEDSVPWADEPPVPPIEEQHKQLAMAILDAAGRGELEPFAVDGAGPDHPLPSTGFSDRASQYILALGDHHSVHGGPYVTYGTGTDRMAVALLHPDGPQETATLDSMRPYRGGSGYSVDWEHGDYVPAGMTGLVHLYEAGTSEDLGRAGRYAGPCREADGWLHLPAVMSEVLHKGRAEDGSIVALIVTTIAATPPLGTLDAPPTGPGARQLEPDAAPVAVDDGDDVTTRVEELEELLTGDADISLVHNSDPDVAPQLQDAGPDLHLTALRIPSGRLSIDPQDDSLDLPEIPVQFDPASTYPLVLGPEVPHGSGRLSFVLYVGEDRPHSWAELFPHLETGWGRIGDRDVLVDNLDLPGDHLDPRTDLRPASFRGGYVQALRASRGRERRHRVLAGLDESGAVTRIAAVEIDLPEA